MTERQFQQQVLNLATFYGWRAYHTHDSRRSQPGFPDLVLIRGPELIFAELKTAKGRVRTEQAEWITDLSRVHVAVHNARAAAERLATPTLELPAVDVYLWRPADFDELHARLARGRHRSEPLHNPARAAA